MYSQFLKTIDEIAVALSLFCVVSLLSSCDRTPPHKTTPYTIDVPSYFPTNFNIPDDNPMTEEGVLLGRHLFYDGRMSGRTHPDSLMSCATCHRQQNFFDVGIDNPRFVEGVTCGLTGVPTPHTSMPLVNLVFNHNGLLWNGFVDEDNPDEDKRQLEDLVWMGITAEHEMFGDTTRVKNMLQTIPEYQQMFQDAFGTPEVTVDRMGKAVAQFIRSIVSYNSKFDKYLRGEVMLTEQELYGYELFMTEEGADCFHCHGGAASPLFTTNLYYNNGKDSIFTGEYEDDRDRYHVTNREFDRGSYRAPTLRNLKYTAPYMHDGRFKTVDEVINFYSTEVVNTKYTDVLMHHAASGGVHLTPMEFNALKAFLNTLNDDDFITDERFSSPW